MKKLLALPMLALLIASCGGDVIPTGSSASVFIEGTGANIQYNYLYKADASGTDVFQGISIAPLVQPVLTLMTRGGSVGVQLNKATIRIVDQNGVDMNLGTLPSGVAVTNPYVQAFPVRLLPGWACPTLGADGTPTGQLNPLVDPSTCPFNQRTGYDRIEYYPNTAGPSQNPTPVDPPPVVNLISQNVASRLVSIANTTGGTFNSAMIITFSGIDDNNRTVSFVSQRIALNVFRGPDQRAL